MIMHISQRPIIANVRPFQHDFVRSFSEQIRDTSLLKKEKKGNATRKAWVHSDAKTCKTFLVMRANENHHSRKLGRTRGWEYISICNKVKIQPTLDDIT